MKAKDLLSMVEEDSLIHEDYNRRKIDYSTIRGERRRDYLGRVSEFSSYLNSEIEKIRESSYSK